MAQRNMIKRTAKHLKCKNGFNPLCLTCLGKAITMAQRNVIKRTAFIFFHIMNNRVIKASYFYVL